MKLPLLPRALLLAALSSCGDSAGSKPAEAVPAKPMIHSEIPARATAAATCTDYSLPELMELGNADVAAFRDAFKAWLPTASDKDIARLYNETPDRRQDITELMIAHDAMKTLEFAVSRALGGNSSVVGIQSFEAVLKASPAASAQRAFKLPPGELRTLAFQALFRSGEWRAQKAEFIARVGELYEEEQGYLGGGLARTASDARLLETDLATAPPRTREAFVRVLAERWADEKLGSMDALIAQVPESMRAMAAENFFERLSVNDPQAALAMAEQRGLNDVNVAAAKWAGEDPVAAMDYFAARPRWEEGLTVAFTQWLWHDPIEASEYAASRLKGRAAEVAAVEIAKECWKHGDVAGEQRWMETITDPVLRKRASTK